MAKIGIVTDSTADLPLDYYVKHDVTMVPLLVRFGNDSYKDWIEMPPGKFYPMLTASSNLPKTSQPSVQDFIEAYGKHSDCDHIISVHLSSHLSGTYQSASIAAQSVSTPVTVIDGKQASVGTAMLVKALVEDRAAGKTIDEMIAHVESLADKIRIVFCVETLKYLEMGGRIGRASAMAGSLLNIKPILTLDDGVVAPLRKVKGHKRLIRELVDIIKEAAAGRRVVVALLHAAAPDSLAELETALKQERLDIDLSMRGEIGSVIGTYTGPGTFAAMFYPAE